MASGRTSSVEVLEADILQQVTIDIPQGGRRHGAPATEQVEVA